MLNRKHSHQPIIGCTWYKSSLILEWQPGNRLTGRFSRLSTARCVSLSYLVRWGDTVRPTRYSLIPYTYTPITTTCRKHIYNKINMLVAISTIKHLEIFIIYGIWLWKHGQYDIEMLINIRSDDSTAVCMWQVGNVTSDCTKVLKIEIDRSKTTPASIQNANLGKYSWHM